jgi:4-amino-4-deoxy-L-arabinose transferase-like glycosyltransferase
MASVCVQRDARAADLHAGCRGLATISHDRRLEWRSAQSAAALEWRSEQSATALFTGRLPSQISRRVDVSPRHAHRLLPEIARSILSTVSAVDETVAVDAPEATLPAVRTGAGGRRRQLLSRLRSQHVALGCIVAGSLVLNTHRLAQNGYGNTFYSAAVKSMLHSLHNFLYVSFDPGGLVTIDKPPLAVWVQVASAKVFGFSPLSVLLPEAIIGALAVAALYRVIAPRLGAVAALASALALAVFPSFVAVSRDNGVDPLLILLAILACGAALAAIESGRWRSLLACAVLVGLAFNTKTLAAYLILPGIACAYVVCAPGPLTRRVGRLLLAGVVMAAVSFSWIAFVELTPASQRPFVGSSTNNTEIGLTFDYNGFGRVEGEIGGPGNVPVAEGAGLKITPRPAPLRALAPLHRVFAIRDVPAHRTTAPTRTAAGVTTTAGVTPAPTAGVAAAPASAPASHRVSPYLPNGHLASPLFFAEPPGPLRLFQSGLADQAAWLLPFALIGLLALAVLAFAGGRARRNPRLATLIVFGGWLLVEAVILSYSKGIVHPYYVSAMAPGAAVMVGAGATALASLARDRHWGAVLLPCAVAATVATQIVILHEQHYLGWLVPVLIGGTLAGVCAMGARRLASAGMALTLGVLLIAPTAYAASTWLGPVEGTFPAAGPHEAIAKGELDSNHAELYVDRQLIRYVTTHHPATRWTVLADASPTAAPLILLGIRAGAMGGYSGTDPALDGPQLARLVARGEARYVLLGGAYASRGGNLATKAVLHACRLIAPSAWHGPPPATVYTPVLFDCAGRERALAGALGDPRVRTT